jgi:hypothetical protein
LPRPPLVPRGARNYAGRRRSRCARLLAFGEPVPRIYSELVDLLIEARGSRFATQLLDDISGLLNICVLCWRAGKSLTAEELDDRFHETGLCGTGVLFVDSSFVVG